MTVHIFSYKHHSLSCIPNFRFKYSTLNILHHKLNAKATQLLHYGGKTSYCFYSFYLSLLFVIPILCGSFICHDDDDDDGDDDDDDDIRASET